MKRDTLTLASLAAAVVLLLAGMLMIAFRLREVQNYFLRGMGGCRRGQ